jgi:hypothetical protein
LVSEREKQKITVAALSLLYVNTPHAASQRGVDDAYRRLDVTPRCMRGRQRGRGEAGLGPQRASVALVMDLHADARAGLQGAMYLCAEAARRAATRLPRCVDTFAGTC